ncbi:MAG: DUF4942 domain-containing protein [Rhodospirillales bacterium]|nr:DUF4942 domain-containing protein [Rhodospirillales bacterium]
MNAELVPRTTVTEICARRRSALALYATAYSAISSADNAIGSAIAEGRAAGPVVTRFNHHHQNAAKMFLARLEVPDRDQYLDQARRIVDTDVWAHIIELTGLRRLMDKTAKDQFQKQLLEDPPEVTEENILATLKQLATDQDTIFKRGIAECFSKLDRRFKSHDGFKIGHRIILDRAFDEWGSWNYHRNHRDTFFDIERTFYVLEGLDPPEYGGLSDVIEKARAGGWGKRQSEVETEFFKVCCYKNGNAHVWFKRDDLIERVNKLLAEYYGEVVPDGRQAEDDGGLFTPKTTPAKHYGFYPTPDTAAAIVIDRSDLYHRKDEEALTVLEPSAGTGNLASLAAAEGAIVDCVEYQAHLATDLQRSGLYRRVTQMDFLAMQPDPERLYNRLIMNPPFDMERDIDHVMHAWKFLKPEGRLIAIMSAGTEFRTTRKATAFRAFMKKRNANWRDLPAGSFSSVGTNVNTILLTVTPYGQNCY